MGFYDIGILDCILNLYFSCQREFSIIFWILLGFGSCFYVYFILLFCCCSFAFENIEETQEFPSYVSARVKIFEIQIRKLHSHVSFFLFFFSGESLRINTSPDAFSVRKISWFLFSLFSDVKISLKSKLWISIYCFLICFLNSVYQYKAWRNLVSFPQLNCTPCYMVQQKWFVTTLHSSTNFFMISTFKLNHIIGKIVHVGLSVNPVIVS